MKKLVWAYISHPDIIFLNPLAMFAPIGDMEYEQVMGYCLEALRDSDMVVMSGKYTNSDGCMRELREARALEMPIRYYLSEDDPFAMEQPQWRC